jgi:hypothetical protein
MKTPHLIKDDKSNLLAASFLSQRGEIFSIGTLQLRALTARLDYSEAGRGELSGWGRAGRGEKLTL